MKFSPAAVLFLTSLCVHGNAFATQQSSSLSKTHPLTNQDVVRMTKASFDDATIIKTIESHTASFDLSVDALLRLKELGVSQPVIQAMLATGPDRKPVAAAPATAAGFTVKPADSAQFPEEVGVYQVVKGKLVAIEPEIVNWRTGGVIKSTVTLGLDKGHMNGTVAGPHSPITVASTPLGMAGPALAFLAEKRPPGIPLRNRWRTAHERRRFQQRNRIQV